MGKGVGKSGNCSQLGPGLAGWFVGFGFGSSTPKDKKTGQSVADPGSARSAVPNARAPGAPGRPNQKVVGTQHSIAVRAVHQLKRRDPLSIQPASHRTRSLFCWACELQRPKHRAAPSDKDTTCGHPIISTKAGPSPSVVFPSQQYLEEEKSQKKRPLHETRGPTQKMSTSHAATRGQLNLGIRQTHLRFSHLCIMSFDTYR